MKKILAMILATVATVSVMTTAASAATWYGTGNNFGSGWVQSGNTIYGTGNNYGSGYIINGNSIYGTGGNFGSGWYIN